jgi:hypothetical protein
MPDLLTKSRTVFVTSTSPGAASPITLAAVWTPMPHMD